MNGKDKFNLYFGALADPLEEQLRAKGVALKNIKKYDLCMKSISALFIHQFITESERERIYKRYFKALKKDIKENSIPIKEECNND